MYISQKMHFAICRRVRFVFAALVLIFFGFASNGITQEPVKTASTDKPVAVKVFEIGKVSNREFARIWKRENWGFSDWINPLYIINYGNDKEIAFCEKVITDSIAFRKFDRPRITLARGGPLNGPRTVVWRVPYGADNPVP